MERRGRGEGTEGKARKLERRKRGNRREGRNGFKGKVRKGVRWSDGKAKGCRREGNKNGRIFCEWWETGRKARKKVD